MCKTLNSEAVEYDKNMNLRTMLGRRVLVALIPTRMKEPTTVISYLIGKGNNSHDCCYSTQIGYRTNHNVRLDGQMMNIIIVQIYSRQVHQ